MNVFSTGVGQATNAFDPGATLEDSTVDFLKSVIEKVNQTRMAGYYTMSCPLVRMHVSCTPTEVCAGGYWVPGKSRFLITYGSTITTIHYPKEIDVLAFGAAVAPEAARAIQTMRHFFELKNTAPMAKIRAAAKACASGH